MSTSQAPAVQTVGDLTEHHATGSTTDLNQARAPRRSWMEFMLFVFTFGIYAFFWSVGRARDLKNGGGRPLTPWMWFFAPMFLLTGIIAFARFFDELKHVEGHQERQISGLFKVVWLCVFLATITVDNLSLKISVPMWISLTFLVIASVNFSVLHRRINQWKLNQPELNFYGKSNGYTWYEWLVLTIGVPFTLFVVYESVIKLHLISNKLSYTDAHQVIDDEHGFRFKVTGSGWAKVELGTFSTEDPKFEMSGPIEDAYAVVYDFGENTSLSELASFRLQAVRDAYSTVSCDEKQSFTEDKSGAKSMIVCAGTSWGSHYTLISSAFRHEGRTLEFVGEVNRPKKKTNDEVVSQMTSMAQSFQPLNKDSDNE